RHGRKGAREKAWLPIFAGRCSDKRWQTGERFGVWGLKVLRYFGLILRPANFNPGGELKVRVIGVHWRGGKSVDDVRDGREGS
ncbi:hypothetical protein I6F21_37835, partial [Bradyrhizobium sp. NBAIM03]|uniref:hypothetical protein n=1 Tax=Bradyrhizobium sp. NBAIM03 TaxID=2793816 RepID=UPI001CD2F83A